MSAACAALEQRRWTGRGHTPLAIGVAGLVVAVLALGVYEVSKHWPYRYKNVEPLLQSVFASQIKIDRYYRTYWPHPGFVAQGLTLRRYSAPDRPPLGSADELVVQGTWKDLLLLRHRVLLVEVKGMHVVIPPPGSQASREGFPPGSSGDFTGPKTSVELLHLERATLDLMQNSGGRLRFPIRELRIHDLSQGTAVRFEVEMENATPPGKVSADGSFGPIRPKNLGDTPLSGRFHYGPVDLSHVGVLHGILTSDGQFSGTLASVEASANEQTPDFAVGKGRPARADGSIRCDVNALNGDVVFHQIEVKTGATTVVATGGVRGSPKIADLDLQVTRGRAEDLLGPFLRNRPPVIGVVWLKSHAHLDPAIHGAKFLQRLKMAGRFTVPRQKLTNRKTEQSLTAFSERALGGHEKAEEAQADVVSSIDGVVSIRDGVVLSRDLRFGVPGAAAQLAGTYGLRDGAANFSGKLTMDADVSHVTTGWKSVLLKPLAPFFRKKPAGAVVPIKVTGTPGKYRVGQNLLGGK